MCQRSEGREHREGKLGRADRQRFAVLTIWETLHINGKSLHGSLQKEAGGFTQLIEWRGLTATAPRAQYHRRHSWLLPHFKTPTLRYTGNHCHGQRVLQVHTYFHSLSVHSLQTREHGVLLYYPLWSVEPPFQRNLH